MEKMPRLDRNIPQSGRKNQIKLARDQSLYHKATPFCDLSDESTNMAVICEYTLWLVDMCIFLQDLIYNELAVNSTHI